MSQELPSRVPEAELSRPDDHIIENILFTPNGNHFVGFGKDKRTKKGIIDFWDIKTRKLVRVLTQPSEVSSAVFTPDGQRLITAGWDNKMRIFSTTTWKMEDEFEHDPPKQTANYLTMLPDGKRFISGNVGYSGPRIWDLIKREATPLRGEREQVTGLAASKDGKRFAVSFSAPVTTIWDSDSLEIVGRLKLEKKVFVSVAFSPDGKRIATGSIGNLLVTIWDSTSFQKQHECDGLSDAPEALDFTSDSKLLVSCMGAEWNIPAKICIWDVESGKLVYAFSPWKHGCVQQALSPDGRWLVTCGVDCTLRLWDLEKIRREIGK